MDSKGNNKLGTAWSQEILSFSLSSLVSVTLCIRLSLFSMEVRVLSPLRFTKQEA